MCPIVGQTRRGCCTFVVENVGGSLLMHPREFWSEKEAVVRVVSRGVLDGTKNGTLN